VSRGDQDASCAQSGEGFEIDAAEEIIVIVIGKRIKMRNLVSTSPGTQVSSEEFLFQGTTRRKPVLRLAAGYRGPSVLHE
jgi:hypothetical protein